MKKIMFNDKYGLTEAVLSGRKTQTRRICNLTLHDFDGNQYHPERIFHQDGLWKFELFGRLYHLPKESQPKYQIGEVVAVAQSYYDAGFGDNIPIIGIDENGMPIFANEAGIFNKMFVRADLMPHQIRFNDLWVERLQDISDEDCIKEGIEWNHKARMFYVNYNQQTGSHIWLGTTPRNAYAALIDKISGKGTWESNPYVFVYDFELVR